MTHKLDRETKRKLAKLEALEAGGVSNWEWYDDSLSAWREEDKKLTLIESACTDIFSILAADCTPEGLHPRNESIEEITDILLKLMEESEQ